MYHLEMSVDGSGDERRARLQIEWDVPDGRCKAQQRKVEELMVIGLR